MAIAAECFLPERNGVTNTVLRVIEHLEARGHEAVVLAPGFGPSRHSRTPVERVPAVPLPVYRNLAVGLPTARIGQILREFSPDVVHLAAPAVLGAEAARVARVIGVPSVAVYQTDFAGFARRYGIGVAAPAIWGVMRRIHRRADLTLAPSSSAAWQLGAHGIGPVSIWGRGVDAGLFNPVRRSEFVRRQLAPSGRLIVGYVGRLAAEKQVESLRFLQAAKEVEVVVVGDGPARAQLERQLPFARFLGFRTGVELAAIVASLDVFVHTGPHETFCQAIQEALASGVPVVAPAAGGLLDLVRHGENGWLFPPDSPELMIGAVDQLGRDPEWRRTMGIRARASVEHRTWEVLGDELIGHYQALIGPARRVRNAA